MIGKEVLLWFLGVMTIVHATPVFYNGKQTGTSNYYLNLTDTNIVLIPSKELMNTAVNIALGRSNEPWSILTNRFFRLAGAGVNPSQDPVPLTSTQEPETKPEVQETPTTAKPGTVSVSTTQKPSTTTTATAATTTTVQIKKKSTKKEDNGELTLIQAGIEECGPEGHRDSLGICVYDVPTPK